MQSCVRRGFYLGSLSLLFEDGVPWQQEIPLSYQDYKILLKDPAPDEHLRLLYGGKELNGTCLHVFNCLVVNHCISPSAFTIHLLSQADAFLLCSPLSGLGSGYRGPLCF